LIVDVRNQPSWMGIPSAREGSHALDRHALAVMRELWHWRNKEALAANRRHFLF